MKFIEADKVGEVLGNKVKAKPVPFRVLLELNTLQKSGEYEKVVQLMIDTVNQYVTMEDGEEINATLISQRALTELFNFATSAESSFADFTNTGLPEK